MAPRHPLREKETAMHRGIPTDAQPESCPRCGGHPPAGQQLSRQTRVCNCWDPLVEWLMDRSDKQR